MTDVAPKGTGLGYYRHLPVYVALHNKLLAQWSTITLGSEDCEYLEVLRSSLKVWEACDLASQWPTSTTNQFCS